MRITIEHYGQKFVWENEYGTHGIGDRMKIDETNLDNAIETFAALLVAAGWQEQTVKDIMYEYGRTEFPEEV